MKAVKTLKDLPEADLEGLKGIMEDQPVRIVVLFGSTATGEADRLSDLDIGVVFEDGVDEKERLDLMDSLTAAVIDEAGFSAVDLVDLERVRPGVAYRALDTGKILVGDEEKVLQLKERLLTRKLGFKRFREEWQDSLTQRIAGVSGGS